MYQALTFSHLRDHVLAEAPCVCGFTIIHILVLLDVKVKFLTLSLTHSFTGGAEYNEPGQAAAG